MKCNQKSLDTIDKAIERTMSILHALLDIRGGASVSESLAKHGTTYTNYVSFLSSKWMTDETKDTPNDKIHKITLNGAEDLWYALYPSTAKLSDVPSDIEKTMETYIHTRLTNREIKIIRMYHWEHMTLEEIASKMTVTRERVRQVIQKAYRKLRWTAGREYLLCGDAYYRREKLERLEKERDYKRAQLRILRAEIGRLENDLQYLTDRHLELAHQEMTPPEIKIEDMLYADLDLSVRALNSVVRAMFCRTGATSDKITIKDIAEVPFIEFLHFSNLGRKSAVEIMNEVYKETGFKLWENDKNARKFRQAHEFDW